MKLFFQLVILCILSSKAEAQRVCGNADYSTKVPTITSRLMSQASSTYSRDTISDEIINIPIVIHLLFNTAIQNISDEQLRSQLTVINNDYRRLNADAANTPEVFRPRAADSRISFCLAQVDPQGRATRGIIRKHTNTEYFLGDDGMKFSAAGGDDAWDSRKYLNIWVCNMFGRSLGYATPPGGPADKDGVVINYDVFGTTGILRADFDKGRTATHEVGHWLGLIHTWGDESCGSDGVDDTPRQLSYNFGCPTFPHVTSCSENANGDMFMNYMDLTNDACMNMFTTGQKLRMRSLFSQNGLRNSFLYSTACDSNLATGAPLPDDTLPTAKPIGRVSVYPNPVRDIAQLRASDGYQLEGKICVVFNNAGVMMLQQKLSSETPSLNLSKLAAGFYILKIGDGAEKKMLKIIRL